MFGEFLFHGQNFFGQYFVRPPSLLDIFLLAKTIVWWPNCWQKKMPEHRVAKVGSDLGILAVAVAASTGYAIPGTMLSIGVLIFAGIIDRSWSGIVGDQRATLLLGGAGVLMTAYIVRFQAVGYGAMMSGIRRLPDNMMNASRVLGQGFGASLKRVVMPLLGSSMLAGGLLVFVDVMKELPITLLLRPFDFETLATYTYQYANCLLYTSPSPRDS